ncbi:MAG TPA: hypothetical protein VGC36_12540 [Rhizomicrobium sp.]
MNQEHEKQNESGERKPYSPPVLETFGPITNMVRNLPNVGGDGSGVALDSATS